VIVSDGCLMEGISHEAASFVGHLGLGRLVVLWDDNAITIDGSVDRSCSGDQLARFAAYGWHTEAVLDGTDIEAHRPGDHPRQGRSATGAPGVEGTANARAGDARSTA
jgi:transketolase